MSAATQAAAGTAILPELDDLDLLDDSLRHAACGYCYPPGTVGLLETFIAICGRRTIRRGPHVFETPPNACPECRTIPRCPRCGLEFSS